MRWRTFWSSRTFPGPGVSCQLVDRCRTEAGRSFLPIPGILLGVNSHMRIGMSSGRCAAARCGSRSCSAGSKACESCLFNILFQVRWWGAMTQTSVLKSFSNQRSDPRPAARAATSTAGAADISPDLIQKKHPPLACSNLPAPGADRSPVNAPRSIAEHLALQQGVRKCGAIHFTEGFPRRFDFW